MAFEFYFIYLFALFRVNRDMCSILCETNLMEPRDMANIWAIGLTNAVEREISPQKILIVKKKFQLQTQNLKMA